MRNPGYSSKSQSFWILLTVALALLLVPLAIYAQSPPGLPPCPTCVTGGGTPGTVPIFTNGSTATQGVVKDSRISQDADGNVLLGPVVNGTPTGNISGHLATFDGDLGGVVGADRHIDPNLFLSGVIGLIDNNSGAAVRGRANATTGSGAIGVFGRSFGDTDAIGVSGTAGPAPTNAVPNPPGSTFGVSGRSMTTEGIGVFGVASAGEGPTVGVRARVRSPNGTAAVFDSFGGGDLIVGVISDAGVRTFRVDNAGNVYAAGSFFPGSNLADVAERIDTTELLTPGDVVEIDPANSMHFRKSRQSFSTRVAGIVSTAPAITLASKMDQGKSADTRPVLALVGRVPVSVTTEGGAIQVGDLLTTSSTPGVAMRCSDRSACVGAILGKALEPLGSGTGRIQVLVTLQ